MSDRVTHNQRRWASSRVTAILIAAAAYALLFTDCAQHNKNVCCAAAQTIDFETSEVTQEDAKGHLVIEGAGGTVEIRKRTLELAGGGKAKVLVIPQASSEKDIGRVVAEGWKKLGAGDVAILDLSDPEKAVAAVMNADLVWMSGGNTMRLINALKKTGVAEAIRRRYREGAVIGGTSAGATVMSKFMLSTDGISEGLGLWTEAICQTPKALAASTAEQRFLEGYRFNRLLEAVLDRPELIGVGIDERTAVFVHGKSFEVVGDSKVLVLDARKAKIENGMATDVVLHVLRQGRLMPSVFGEWLLIIETGRGSLPQVLTLKEDMTGTYQMRDREVPIKELKIEEQEITFKQEMRFEERSFTIDFRGKVEGDIINGEFTTPEGKRDVKGKWIGTETTRITAEEAIDRLDKMIETAKQTGTVENIDEAVATIEAAGEDMETADLLEKLDVLQEHRKDRLLPKPEKALSSNQKLDWAILNKNVCCAAAQTIDFETSEVTQEDAKGHLVIDGASGEMSEIRKRTLELAGGGKAKVLLIPQASSEKDRGQVLAEGWKKLGAGDIAILDLSDPEKAVAAVMNADLVWMSGGKTMRLINALKETEVPEALRRRYREGAVIGGASAGATVMSKFMLSNSLIYEGLGLWPEAIVDQHFLERYRFNRLLEAVLDRPELLGFGIDEQTAVFIHGKFFEVVGDNNVLVLDARKAKIENGVATDVVLHVLRQGRLTIEITGPVKDCFDPGESVLLEAKATVYKGSKVRTVEFIVDGKTIASDTDAPYVFNWAGAEEGRHTIKAKIYDSKGRTEESLPVTIFVGMRALERFVSHSTNDAEEFADGSMHLKSTDLELINDGQRSERGDQVVGMRFTDFPIPHGAQIKKAYVQFTVDEVRTKPTNLVIHAETTPYYRSWFAMFKHNISSRKRTKASVKWSPEPWNVIGERSEKQRTPDLSAIIQEVVAQSDWQEASALVFIITGSGERCAVSYDGDQQNAPMLYIEY
ncbi:MAG: cyanophycinase [Planctomycetota bacterium]